MTSDQPEDDILEREAHIACASGVIRGSISDVRSRYFSLSEATNCDYLVRVTGDNPFIDFRIIQPLVSQMRYCQSDYLWLDPGCCPDGINLEVFTPKLLQASIDNSVSPKDLEHVTPWMKSHMEHRGFWSDFYDRESFNYHLGIDIPDDYFKILNLLGDRCFDMEFLQSDAIVDWLIQRMIISSTYPRLRRHPL